MNANSTPNGSVRAVTPARQPVRRPALPRPHRRSRHPPLELHPPQASKTSKAPTPSGRASTTKLDALTFVCHNIYNPGNLLLRHAWWNSRYWASWKRSTSLSLRSLVVFALLVGMIPGAGVAANNRLNDVSKLARKCSFSHKHGSSNQSACLALRKIAAEDNDAGARAAAIDAIGQEDSAGSDGVGPDEDFLANIAVDDKDASVRRAATRLLGNQRQLASIAALDADESVRSVALQRTQQIAAESKAYRESQHSLELKRQSEENGRQAAADAACRAALGDDPPVGASRQIHTAAGETVYCWVDQVQVHGKQ